MEYMQNNEDQYFFLTDYDKIKVAEKAANVVWKHYSRYVSFADVEAYAYTWAFAHVDRRCYENYLEEYGNDSPEAEKKVLFHVVCSCLKSDLYDEVQAVNKHVYIPTGNSDPDADTTSILDNLQSTDNPRWFDLMIQKRIASEVLNKMEPTTRKAIEHLMTLILDSETKSHVSDKMKVIFNRPELQAVAEKHGIGYKRLENAWDSFCKMCQRQARLENEL